VALQLQAQNFTCNFVWFAKSIGESRLGAEMKTTRILLGLVILCGAAFSAFAQTITTTPTNGPTTITIHARTTDGKLPVDVSCKVVQATGQFLSDPTHQPLSLVGKSGDWTAANVTPEIYEVVSRSPNYAEDMHSIVQYLSVKAGSNYFIDFVLSRGATFKGRVLDDATGKPIANAILSISEGSSQNPRTDAEGRYELSHIAGKLIIDAQTTNHVMQRIYVDGAAEDSTVSVPDIRLQHGGWISGRVEPPAEVESNAFVTVSLEIQGSLPTNALIHDTYPRTDGTFRTGSLPPGIYTLRAEWRKGDMKGGSRQTLQAKGSVSGIKVIVGQDTSNVLIPTKWTIPANDQSDR
jgi:hypothetical protein